MVHIPIFFSPPTISCWSLPSSPQLYLNSPQDAGEAYDELSVQPPASNGLQQVF